LLESSICYHNISSLSILNLFFFALCHLQLLI
jgi:hypothetical protein